MQKQVREVAVYICEVCKIQYDSEKEARACEKRPVETKKFRVGDEVSNHEPRNCRGEDYTFTGRVAKILDPEPPDEEYENKWLGWVSNHKERMNSHVIRYLVKYTCPVCNEKNS